MQFTSEEVQKLKQRQKSQVPPPAPPPKPRTSASGLLESSFDIGHYSKSTPSLENPKIPQISPRSTTSADGGKKWKNSLESLKNVPSNETADGIPRGFTAVPVTQPPTFTSSHSHSNSDSGLSSLSGRASTMSPISTMSTVSSVSSASSSGSSSRASLRSASIVSSCTIPLDEEDEDLQSTTSTILSRKISVKLPEESQCELLAQQLLDIIDVEEPRYKKLVSLIGKFLRIFRLILARQLIFTREVSLSLKII